jgi:protein-S-isoprenylcysteine O-methyltransferase Ste14
MADPKKDSAGIKFPPPLIYLLFLLAGLALERVWPVGLVPGVARFWIGGALLALALACGLWARAQFRRAGTPIRPDRTTTAIVSTGPYAYSRNPLYLTLAAVYLGIAVLAESAWAILLLLPALWTVQRFVIGREERYLEGKFGEVYRAYKESVRRWL